MLLYEHILIVAVLDVQLNFDFRPFVGELYSCTLQKLRAPEVDQEVKERAIACMGQIIANMGDVLQSELITCLPLFMERLRNEVTRLSSVKALTMIAASPLRINLSPILNDAIPALGSFLRKNQRALKLNSLTLLDTLVIHYSNYFEPQLLKIAISELPPLLSESDLHVAQLSLVLLTSAAKQHPQALKDVHEVILPEIMILLRSPLLQGSALTCTLNLFQSLVQANLPGLGYRQLLAMLMQPVTNPQQQLHKQAFYSLSKSIAALTLQMPNEAIPIATEFLHEIQNRRSDSHLVFYLLTIGEIGRFFNLSSIEQLPQCMLNCFATTSEEVKGAASHALGAVAVGNLTYYLPFILAEIENQPKRQYLLLHSLKEVISSLSTSKAGLEQLMPSVPSIWTQLFKHCECPEEGIILRKTQCNNSRNIKLSFLGSRNVVAECLGKLVLVNPEELLPRLQQALKSDSALMKTAVVTAIKFTISDQPQPIDPMLKQCIGQFLFALQDPEPSVRRVALVAFNSAVHNKPSLVRDLLPDLLPQLYSETKVKKELIREVEMGPFKHTVDDGLDIRKAAFECMYTLLEQGLERVDIMQFLEYVISGLRDHYDIKMLTYLMTARLAHLCPAAVLQSELFE